MSAPQKLLPSILIVFSLDWHSDFNFFRCSRQFVVESEAQDADIICENELCIHNVYNWLGIFLLLVEGNALSFCGRKREAGF